MKVEISDYMGIFDNAFNPEECRAIIAEFEHINDNTFISAKLDGQTQFDNGKLGRSDSSLFFERVSPDFAKLIQSRVIDCLGIYKQTYSGLDNTTLASYTCKVQKTSVGGGYHVWHSEHGGDYSAWKREVVWAVYLTTHQNSGETEFLQQGKRVEAVAGRVVLWPASYTHLHRGNPPYDKEKYIATGWFEHHEPMQVIDLNTTK